MGVPVGTAGGASRWNGGPAHTPGPHPLPVQPPRRPHHPSEVDILPLAPFLERRLEGVENPSLGKMGSPKILSIAQAWGWFPSLALPAAPRLCPSKTATNCAEGLPCFDPHRDGHCLCCWLEPCRQQLPPPPPKKIPPLRDQLCPQPHNGSSAPQMPFLRSSKINLSPWFGVKDSCCVPPSNTPPLHLGSGARGRGDEGHGSHLAARCIPVPVRCCRSADADPGGVSRGLLALSLNLFLID